MTHLPHAIAGPLVLLIEDEAPLRKFLRAALAQHGFRFVEASTGAEGLTQAHAHNPDLVLLDLGLPDMDGLSVTQKLREWTSVPIVIISARGREEDKIAALDGGADDYLTKPFGTGELLARIRVALRHAARPNDERDPSVTFGELKVDFELRKVELAGIEVHLTPIEYKLLATMVRGAGKVLTHRQLLKEVWGPGYENQTQYLRVYMSQLRHKLEKDPARPAHLLNEPGVGYRLKTGD